MWIEIVLISLLSSAFIYWQSGQTIKEIALANTTAHCQKLELQLLDGYIALARISLQRDCTGKIQGLREYHFEFSATGFERYQGKIIMLGRHVQQMELAPYRC